MRRAGEDRAGAALRGFGILGTNAALAIPALTTMMRDTTRPATAKLSIMALSRLGAPAFPEMAAAVADTNYVFRDRVAHSIIYMVSDVGTNACLALLTSLTNDPNPVVASSARYGISEITAEAEADFPGDPSSEAHK